MTGGGSYIKVFGTAGGCKGVWFVTCGAEIGGAEGTTCVDCVDEKGVWLSLWSGMASSLVTRGA